MAETAAHLVDHVFPEVPVRQWVLSVPFALRYRLAYDSSLVRDVLQIFVRTIFSSIRRRAGVPASNRKARCGAVGFIQRFSDALYVAKLLMLYIGSNSASFNQLLLMSQHK